VRGVRRAGDGWECEDGAMSMMRLTLWCGLVVGLGSLTSPGVARADWHSFWDRVHLDWHRNNAWPQPFSAMDRSFVRQPIALQIRNGWRMQNTLSDELFDMETQELTTAGKRKVRWIFTQAPPSRRTVYVLRGETDAMTRARLRSVRRAVANMQGVDADPRSVVLIGVPPRHGAGDYLDRIRRSYEASTPSPRLPARQEESNN